MRKATGVTILAAMFALFAAVPAQASAGSDEATFLRLLNERRQNNGKRALVLKSDLSTIARRHSGRMAERNELYHNPNLANEVKGEDSVGENVGVGPDPESLDQAFWDSKGHRGNILWSGYNQVGIGVVHSKWHLHVTFVFVKRSSSSTKPPAQDDDDEPSAKKPSSSGNDRSSGSNASKSDSEDGSTQAAPPARRPASTGGSRGTPVQVREPERAVDLLVRTVALDFA